jgi:hypothetical protein
MTSIGSLNLELDGNLTYSHMLGCLKRIETGVTFQTQPNKIGFTLQKREWVSSTAARERQRYLRCLMENQTWSLKYAQVTILLSIPQVLRS